MNKSTEFLRLGVLALTLCTGNAFAEDKAQENKQSEKVEQTVKEILKTADPQAVEKVINQMAGRFSPPKIALILFMFSVAIPVLNKTIKAGISGIPASDDSQTPIPPGFQTAIGVFVGLIVGNLINGNTLDIAFFYFVFKCFEFNEKKQCTKTFAEMIKTETEKIKKQREKEKEELGEDNENEETPQA